MQTQEFHENEALELIDQATELCSENFERDTKILDLEFRINECPGQTDGQVRWLEYAERQLRKLRYEFAMTDRYIAGMQLQSRWHTLRAAELEAQLREGKMTQQVTKRGANDRAKRKANQQAKSLAAKSAKDKPWQGQHIGPRGSHSNQPKPKAA